jgi:hypothetical protein
MSYITEAEKKLIRRNTPKGIREVRDPSYEAQKQILDQNAARQAQELEDKRPGYTNTTIAALEKERDDWILYHQSLPSKYIETTCKCGSNIFLIRDEKNALSLNSNNDNDFHICEHNHMDMIKAVVVMLKDFKSDAEARRFGVR